MMAHEYLIFEDRSPTGPQGMLRKMCALLIARAECAHYMHILTFGLYSYVDEISYENQ